MSLNKKKKYAHDLVTRASVEEHNKRNISMALVTANTHACFTTGFRRYLKYKKAGTSNIATMCKMNSTWQKGYRSV